MSWSVKTFRLVTKPTDHGLFCGKNELTLGGAPLLVETNFGLEPRPLSDLQQTLDDAYGPEAGIDASPLISGLQSIARALNTGDSSHAAMLSLMLQLPEIDSVGMLRLRRSSTVIAQKYNDDEARDRRGRWSTGSDPEPAAGPKRRRLDGHWKNPNIVPTQAALPLPLFPPSVPGGTFGSPKPKDDYVFPSPMPQTNTTSSASDNASTDTHAANDNAPRACPDPSYEPDSVGRTPEQLRYQAQISGLKLGFEVMLNGVGYDGCRESDKTMLEAKFVTPWFSEIPDFIFRQFDGYTETVSQALRQNYSSGGRRIEWHFSDPWVANYWASEFKRLEFDNITVKYTPYDSKYNYKTGPTIVKYRL